MFTIVRHFFSGRLPWEWIITSTQEYFFFFLLWFGGKSQSAMIEVDRREYFTLYIRVFCIWRCALPSHSIQSLHSNNSSSLGRSTILEIPLAVLLSKHTVTLQTFI